MARGKGAKPSPTVRLPPGSARTRRSPTRFPECANPWRQPDLEPGRPDTAPGLRRRRQRRGIYGFAGRPVTDGRLANPVSPEGSSRTSFRLGRFAVFQPIRFEVRRAGRSAPCWAPETPPPTTDRAKTACPTPPPRAPACSAPPRPPRPPPSAASAPDPSAAPELPASGTPYRVLARKYRPSTFAELIGQDALVRTLRNAFAQNRWRTPSCSPRPGRGQDHHRPHHRPAP